MLSLGSVSVPCSVLLSHRGMPPNAHSAASRAPAALLSTSWAPHSALQSPWHVPGSRIISPTSPALPRLQRQPLWMSHSGAHPGLQKLLSRLLGTSQAPLASLQSPWHIPGSRILFPVPLAHPGLQNPLSSSSTSPLSRAIPASMMKLK